MIEKQVFISVKHEIGNWLIVNHVAIPIPEGMTETRVAKLMRKDVCENPSTFGYSFSGKLIPSEFAWAIYDSKDNPIPIKKSINWIETQVDKNIQPATT